MFKRTATAGLIPALVVAAVLMVALTIPAGASRPATVSTSCDGSPYSRVTVNISASPASPTVQGTAVLLTGTSTGCSNPEYKFFLAKPGHGWLAVSGFGGATFNWNTTGAVDGIWGIGVWVRQIGSTKAYAAYALATHRILAACLSASLTATPASPQVKGGVITLGASSVLCPLPQYKFWVLIRNHWVAFGPYSSTPTKAWNTASYQFKLGRNMLGVWARNTGSTRAYESYAIITFYLV
jgi:hypothetical protein